MIMVEMRDEEFVDIAQGDSELPEALGSTAAGVEQHAMLAGFYERRRAEPVQTRDRVTGAEQRHVKCLALSGR
jgi:hypothetical protein